MSLKPKITYQYKMISDCDGNKKWEKEKIIRYCDFHRFADKDDFIDVTIKKTGKVVRRCKYCQRDRIENKKIRLADYKKHKDNLTDYYIRRQLVRGSKNPLPMDQYPDSLVEAKRAVLKLKRETDKLNGPIRTCETHGKLYREDVIKGGKNKRGDIRYKCKKCMKEWHDKHYQLNKLKVLNSHAKYRKENKEKVAKSKKESYKKNKHKYLAKDNARKRMYDKKSWELLKDRAIKKLLVRNTKISQTDIPHELIDAMRAVQLLKRGIKARLIARKIGVKKSDKN